MRCPQTETPIQHLGRKRYRLARRTMRCILEEGHEGSCAWELQPEPLIHCEHCHKAHTKGHVMCEMQQQLGAIAAKGEPVLPGPGTTYNLFAPRTTEQIAEADARYREHLRRKRGR